MKDPRVVSAVTAAVVLAAVVVVGWLGRRRRSWRARSRARHAVSGERTAERLLARAGFAIVDRQVGHRWRIAVDGDEVTAGLRCDYLVERDQRPWVAEVKTGQGAPRLDNPATRRQLLEYQVAYDVDGVVLVDADAGTVREICFALPAVEAAPVPAPWRWLAVGVALGAAITAALLG